MSAFVVGNSTIHNIVAYIRRHPELLPYPEGEQMQRAHDRFLMKSGPYDPENPPRDPWELFAEELRLLNVAAVQARYPDTRTGGSMPGPIGPDGGLAPYEHRDIMCPRPCVAHKALRSWLYQCGEGTIPETELYKKMERVCYCLSNDIVSKLPEWEAAAWG